MFCSKFFLCVVIGLLLISVTNQRSFLDYFLDFPIEPPENPVDLIRAEGYPAEEYVTTTEDGYIIPIHRIPNDQGVPVLLMHGLCSSSADSINYFTNISLGFVLWNAGYDVWLGNSRGNSYCKGHVSIDKEKDPKAFYNFSWHEIGKYDIPTIIDYIIDNTEHEKIHYVGISQAGTTFYVAMSHRPEYNKKIRLATLMSPVGLLKRTQHSFIAKASMYVNQIESTLNYMGIYRLPFADTIRAFMKRLCQNNDNYSICKMFLLSFIGYSDDELLTKEFFPMLYRTTPSICSLKQIYHYLQEMKHGKFAEYDYGVKRNLQIYGSPEPKEYQITLIDAPVAVFYAEYDRLVTVEDIREVIKKLPNLVKEHVVPLKDFNHIDFLFAKNLNSLVHKDMLEIMEQY